MLSIDWSPVTEDYDGFNIFGFMQDVSTNRFRILVHALGEKKVGGKLHAGARVGFGVDITHVTFESSGPFGGNREVSDTDTGIAVEVGGGLWFDVSDTLQIGGELALPMSFHADDNEDEIDLNDYVGIDLDILFGVRFLSK